MSGFPTVNFGQSERGLFSPEEIRRLMEIEHARSARYDYPLALFLIEIDRLEALHDLYGFESKDRILRSVVALLRSATRASDVLGCLRGQRLMALFPHTGAEAARTIARRLCTGCRALDFKSEGRSLRASLSIGIALRRGESTLEELAESAEEALNAAVRTGGDRFLESERTARARPAPPPAAPPPVAPPPFAKGEVPAAVPARPRRSGPPLVVLPSVEELPGVTLEEKVQSLFRALGPGSQEREALEREVITLLRRTVTESRAHTTSGADAAAEIELLERRVTKLKEMLDATEEELARLVQEKSADPGLSSIYRTVQGLAPGAKDYGKKRELLTVIYRANLELLRQLKELS